MGSAPFSAFWLVSDLIKMLILLAFMTSEFFQNALFPSPGKTKALANRWNLCAMSIFFLFILGAHEPGYFGWQAHAMLAYSSLGITAALGLYITLKLAECDYRLATVHLHIPRAMKKIRLALPPAVALLVFVPGCWTLATDSINPLTVSFLVLFVSLSIALVLGVHALFYIREELIMKTSNLAPPTSTASMKNASNAKFDCKRTPMSTRGVFGSRAEKVSDLGFGFETIPYFGALVKVSVQRTRTRDGSTQSHRQSFRRPSQVLARAQSVTGRGPNSKPKRRSRPPSPVRVRRGSTSLKIDCSRKALIIPNPENAWQEMKHKSRVSYSRSQPTSPRSLRSPPRSPRSLTRKPSTETHATNLERQFSKSVAATRKMSVTEKIRKRKHIESRKLKYVVFRLTWLLYLFPLAFGMGSLATVVTLVVLAERIETSTYSELIEANATEYSLITDFCLYAVILIHFAFDFYCSAKERTPKIYSKMPKFLQCCGHSHESLTEKE